MAASRPTLGVPRMIFVNKLDRERASFERTLDAAPRHVRRRHRAARAADRRGGRVPRRRRPAHRHGATSTTRRHATPTARSPTTWPTLEHQVHDNLVEGIVVADDDLLERYLDGDMPIARGARAHARPRRRRRPRCSRSCAARPSRRVGIDRLADFICEIGPSPARPPAGRRCSAGDTEQRGRARPDRPAAGVRVQDDRRPLRRPALAVQGAVGHDPARRPPRQPAHRHRRAAARAVHAARQGAGAASPRCPPATSPRSPSSPTPRTGDTLAPKGTPVRVPAIEPPPPVLAHRDRGPHPGRRRQARRPRCTACRTRTRRCVVDRNDETHQTLLRGHGRDPPRDRARAARSASSASTSTPRTCACPYRETITRHGRGRGQVQEADRRPRPVRRAPGSASSRSSAARASSSSTRSSAAPSPASSSPRCRRASRRRWRTGGVYGFPVVDVRGRRCFDGKYHSVDSSEMSFKMAGSLGFKEAMAKAGAVLLEPVSLLEVTVPAGLPGRRDGRPQRPPRPGAGHRGRRRRRAGGHRARADVEAASGRSKASRRTKSTASAAPTSRSMPASSHSTENGPS